MPSTLGKVTIVCPICHREVSVEMILAPRNERDADGALCIGQLEVDAAGVYAHFLTHGPHDGGEPLPKAA